MSLYSQQNIHLLPKPPRSVLSWQNEATRAQLPNFDNVGQLRSFVHHLFIVDLTNIPGLYIQIKLGASLICLLIIVVFAILGRRMYDRSFWLIRIMKRPSGLVLVPNAMLCFSLIEGLYGALFVALMWESSKFYQTESQRPRSWPLWLLLPWCPLILGAIWAAWGTFFATPNRLQSSAFGVGKRSAMERFFNHAYVINAIGLCSPLVIFVSVAIPGGFSAVRYNRALDRQAAWSITYANEATFTQPMVQEAQSIWFDLMHAMKLMSATFIIWTFWALLMCITYSWVAIRLIKTIGAELKKGRNANGPKFGVVATTRIISSSQEAQEHQDGDPAAAEAFAPSSRNPSTLFPTPKLMPIGDETKGGSDMRKGSLLSNMTSDDGERKAIPMTNFQTPDSQRTMQGTEKKRHSVRLDAGVRKGSSGNEDDDNEGANEADAEVSEIEQRRTIMPNLILRQRTAVSAGRPSRDVRKKELQKAFIHICIQFFAISPACLAFMGVAVLMAVTSFGSTEQPWHQDQTLYSRYLAIALICVNWVTCVFGGVTLIAIAQRTYEPVFSNLHLTTTTTNSSGEGGGGAQMSQNTGGAPANSGAVHPSPISPRLRQSFTLGRMLGRPPHRVNSQKRSLFADDKSTFFETHTRGGNAHQQSTIHHPGNEGSASGLLSERRPQDESMIDIEREADLPANTHPYRLTANDDDDEQAQQHDDRDSLDIAHRGLFIERTIVTVEEDSSEERHRQTMRDSLRNKHSTGTFGRRPSATTADSTKVVAAAKRTPTTSQSRLVANPSNASVAATLPSTPSQQSRFAGQDRVAAAKTGQVDSDDDDEYFRGGAGRRKRSSRTTGDGRHYDAQEGAGTAY